MSPDLDDILAATARLDEEERVVLTIILVDSLGDGTPQAELEAIWAAECERRLADLAAGKSHLLTWDEVKESLDAALDRRMARILRAFDRIAPDRDREPWIRGTRLTVGYLLDSLATDLDVARLLATHGELAPADLADALRYAALASHEWHPRASSIDAD